MVVTAIPLVPLLVMAALLQDTQREASEAARLTRRTLQTKATLDRLQILLVEAELGARGYLLSRAPETLAAFQSANAATGPVVRQLAERLAENPDQMERLARLRADDRPLTSIVEYAQRVPAGGPMPLDLLARSRASMARLRGGIDAMQQAETAHLQRRSDAAQAARDKIRWVLVGGVGFGLAGGLGAALLFASGIAGRVAVASQNAERLAAGQPLVALAPARDEVGALAESLVRASALLNERHAQLDRRLAELAAINKELDAFTYSVSHDLRAPLRHVAGFASLLERSAGESLGEQGRRYLSTITTAAANMGRLIDDLLAFSRMGRAELQEQPVDLNALVAAVVDEVQPERRVIEWAVGPLPGVIGDRAMLRQVFFNLAANAVKYTGKCSQARIEIRALPDDRETVVYVKDNGIGFDMQYVDKLFGVFQRLHSAEEFEGTGIGLANVRRIVQRHGGRVWAEAVPGEGATFYVALPRQGTSEVAA